MILKYINQMLPKKAAFFLTGFLLSIFISGCNNSKPKNLLSDDITISLSPDSSKIMIKGFDEYILKEISVDSLSQTNWENVFSVFLKVEEDMQDLENPIKGLYKINDKTISFVPESPFIKNHIYLVEIYVQNPNTEIRKNLKQENSLFNQKPIRKEVSF